MLLNGSISRSLLTLVRTLKALEAAIKEQVAAGNIGLGNGYGISKCALTALTLVHAKKVVISGTKVSQLY